MHIISELAEMQSSCLMARQAGRTITFVPTMGYLHEGHATLLREGRRRGDLLALSIFVNPTQFGPNEDLSRYPRDFARDEAIARECGVDLLFYPTPETIYPPGYSTWVEVAGALTEVLEGACRPGHFRGVATVVAKLFLIVQPHLAVFGCKDFQQLAVIRRMTADLNLPVEIVGVPTVREADGLAMSSRNVYLSAAEREQALVLSRAIAAARRMVGEGVGEVAAILAELRRMVGEQPAARIDYLEIRHQGTLAGQETVDGDSVLLLAVFVGTTRLIDNALLLS